MVGKILTVAEPEEVELLVSPPTQALGHKMQGGALSFRTLVKKIQLTLLCEKSSNILWSKGRRRKFDRVQTTDGEKLIFCVENIRVLDLVSPCFWHPLPDGTIIGPVLEVHAVIFFDGNGIEVAIQPIANEEYTTYVVNSSERAFVNWNSRTQTRAQVQQWISSSRIRKKWREVTGSHKETCAVPSTKETCWSPVILALRASFSQKEPFWRMRSSGNCSYSFTTWRKIGDVTSKMVTTMLRHCDQKERQLDGSKHWDSRNQYWCKRLHTVRSRLWWWILVTHIHDGSTKKRLQYCHAKKEFMLFPNYSGHSLWNSNKSSIDEIHTYSIRWERVPWPQRKFVVFPICSGEWKNSGRKRGGQSLPKI